jgi:hypothetical protein
VTAPLPPRPLTAGSYFPTTWDPIDSQTHHQIADSIIAIELSLLPGGKLSLQDHVAAADPHPQYSQGGGGMALPLQQDLTFSPDGTFNIGTPGALRPKDIYLTGCVVMNGPDNSTGGWAEVPDYHLCTAYDPYDDTNALFIYNNTPNGDYTHLMLAPSLYEGSGSVIHIYANSDRANSALLELTPSSIHAVRTGSASAPQFELRVGNLAHLAVDASTDILQFGGLPGGALAWQVDSNGMLGATTDNTYDIGDSASTLRPRDLFLGRNLAVDGASTLWGLVTLGGNLYWSSDGGTNQIGGNGFGRPAYLYLTGSVNIGNAPLSLSQSGAISFTGGTSPLQVYTTDDTDVSLGTVNSLRWRVSGQAGTAGNLQAVLDNTYDIGGSSYARPRSVYAATSFVGPGAVPPGGSTGQVLTKTGSADYALGWGAGGGGGGVDANYVFTQGTPSATWVVVHNLNKYPAVDVVDTGGSTVLPSVHYDSLNQVTLTFGSATTGKAYMN